MTSRDEILGKVKEKYGFVPNLMSNMSESPITAEFYMMGSGLLSKGTLNEQERQVAFLSVSQLNGCTYCLAAHGTIAEGSGLSEEQIRALQKGEKLEDARLSAIQDAAKMLVEKKGWLEESEISGFAERGVNREELIELIAIVGLKTVSNYVNHITHTEADEAFQKYAL